MCMSWYTVSFLTNQIAEKTYIVSKLYYNISYLLGYNIMIQAWYSNCTFSNTFEQWFPVGGMISRQKPIPPIYNDKI